MKIFRNILILLIGISGITLLPPFSIFDCKHAPWTNTRSSDDTRTPLKRTRSDKEQLPLLMDTLNDIYLDSEKLKFIKDNPDLLPSEVSLDELNSILDLFFLSSDKLKVIEIFQPRLRDNYSQSEFEKFRNHFFLDSDKLKAIHLINKN